MRWGRLHEEDARRAYTQYLQSQSTQLPVEVTKSGLVVDINEPCLACSPDGNVTIGDSHGLVEFKCPYSPSEFTPEEAAQVCKRKNYSYGVSIIIWFYNIEAVYRYFESRRRQFNDSKPE